MRNRRLLLSNKATIFVILIILLITAAVAFGYKVSRNDNKPPIVTEVTNAPEPSGEASRVADELSMAVLSVRDMSCSGCIATIKASLSGIQGIKDIVVDIGNGKTQVYFDQAKLGDINRLAESITASGYPAKLLRVLTPEEVRKERELAAAKSQYYIASVGGWDIARSDFDTELGVAKRRYSKTYGDNLFASSRGEALLENLKAQIVKRLIDEGILMQEVYKSDFKIDGEIDKELQAWLRNQGKNMEDFKKSLNEVGYDFDYFKKKFETKVLLNRYLNEKILADASNEFERQSLFNSWFNNSKVLAKVVYYDKDLEKLAQRQSQGGSCCPVK
jgi:copper chaperone